MWTQTNSTDGREAGVLMGHASVGVLAPLTVCPLMGERAKSVLGN
ncbi:hypothetical protein ABZ876_25460 [Streptomyces sp. NPDC046931]